MFSIKKNVLYCKWLQKEAHMDNIHGTVLLQKPLTRKNEDPINKLLFRYLIFVL